MAVLGHAKGIFKAGGAAAFGLLTGAAMMYGRAAVDKVVKPTRPVANFSVGGVDGLTVSLQNQAAGDSGWWDFGDGTALEPFVTDQPAAHTYTKPGNYPVKLLVRNFLMEENDRTVPVEVAAPASAAPGLLPKLTLEVRPIGPQSVAPATFQVRGKVENVERAFLDLGDRVELAEVGTFEKYIVLDKPGTSAIQLIGHSGKQVVKQSQSVNVIGDRAGGASAVVRTVDSGTRIEPATWPELVPVPLVKAAKTFEKVVPARPGFTLSAAKLGASPKGVKGLTAAVAADKRSVKLAGEWEAGATEAMVPLTLTGERAVPVSFPQTAAVPFDGSAATVPLPPQRRDIAGLTRRVSVELRMTGPDGKPQVIAANQDLKGKWEQPTADGRVIRAEVVGEQVRVTVGR